MTELKTCFFCGKSFTVKNFDIASLRLLQGLDGICDFHKKESVNQIHILDAGKEKPKPVIEETVKKGYMDLTAEREPGMEG